jgi:hypothetical protein
MVKKDLITGHKLFPENDHLNTGLSGFQIMFRAIQNWTHSNSRFQTALIRKILDYFDHAKPG